MSTQLKILVPREAHVVDVVGQRDEFVKLIEAEFSADILVRGNEITITGDDDHARQAATVFEELIALVEKGHVLTSDAVDRAVRMIKSSNGDIRPSQMSEPLLVIRGRTIRAKTPGQKRYVDAIRKNTLVFAIGPAGTGKSYMAVAMAVRALREKEVSRIILTRPAVEAGEKLGYLPGDIAQKVDPYLKPLYDALYEMLELEHFGRLVERGTIEVAPLAFMRGRAQVPYSRVLTPSGFVPLGTLRVGDLLVGANGTPTRVVGIYPQGEKDIFRVRTQDGASTLCCDEHLWTVTTPGDRERGKPGRVLETRQMRGHLRQFHQHRFELPMVSPVEFPAQDVPLDPYAVGLLLGDGCITGATAPAFTTADPELASALEASGDGSGVIVANPLVSTLRRLELRGTHSSTRFVPESYLLNTVDVRLAVLQGLLDMDGGPVTQAGRSCRVQYPTTSAQLRDDVVFLVRSLGGVAYWRTRRAAGRRPGRANGRDVGYRTDAYVIDVRLPRGIAPFRLTRKLAKYEAYGGERPMRFIDSIEPAGREETLCIRVEAEDSLYVTDDFLVTHNSLNDSFIILDEAQNTTPEQMKMFLTRLGLRSKAVVTGDVTQVDLPETATSGLVLVQQILQGIEGIEFVRLDAMDVVRHKIVQQIVEAYDKHDEARRAATNK